MTDIELAKRALSCENATLAIVKDGMVQCFVERGIAPLTVQLKKDRSALCGFSVADKVIGKAAALLMVYGRVKCVYAAVASAPALEVFHKYGIEIECGRVVARIENRTKTGLCPMESKAMPLSTPEEAIKVFITEADNA